MIETRLECAENKISVVGSKILSIASICLCRIQLLHYLNNLLLCSFAQTLWEFVSYTTYSVVVFRMWSRNLGLVQLLTLPNAVLFLWSRQHCTQFAHTDVPNLHKQLRSFRSQDLTYLEPIIWHFDSDSVLKGVWANTKCKERCTLEQLDKLYSCQRSGDSKLCASREDSEVCELEERPDNRGHLWKQAAMNNRVRAFSFEFIPSIIAHLSKRGTSPNEDSVRMYAVRSQWESQNVLSRRMFAMRKDTIPQEES